jgi:4-diphosphocytidyl-2-C-methyl-D-erythritol kinase
MKVRCPAKINLYLRIAGKRPDGFHNLETLMCPVSIFDEMTLEPAANGEVSLCLEGSDISAGEDNLVMRAARLVQRMSGCGKGARILLRKHIPVGGGLAGGSSNAAHTLMALNELWDCGLPMEKLDSAAATLGSDINFFLYRKPGICTGRGEIINPVTLTAKLYGLLLNPGFGVPTPWAFKTYEAIAEKKGVEGRLLLHGWDANGEVEEFKLRNDLEPAVFSKYLWIAGAKSWLASQDGVLDSMMSGSGATVFALTASMDDAERVVPRAAEYFGAETWIRPVELLY